MKKIILIAAFILFAGLTNLVAQKGHDLQPIPSFDYKLTQQTTEFSEPDKSFAPTSDFLSIAPPSKEKREMEIVISSSSTSPTDVYATVWLIKNKGSQVKGPYILYLDQPFSQQINFARWSVIMTCDFENVKTSVWID